MDIETDTNPIDRSVAHLLFHRPADSSTTPAHGSFSFKSPSVVSLLCMWTLYDNLHQLSVVVYGYAVWHEQVNGSTASLPVSSESLASKEKVSEV